MPKSNNKEEKPIKERAKNYNEKLKVKGSFLDIIKASIKDAKGKDKKK